MKVSEESPRWQWPQAAFAMHRIEEGLHLHSFGNVKTVLCIPIQGRVRETLDMCSLGTCFSWLPATGACLAMGTLSANLSPSPIFVFVHCSAGAWHKRTGRAYVRDCKRLLVVVPCVNRRAPTTLVLRRSSRRRRRSRDGLEGGTRHSSHPREALRRS